MEDIGGRLARGGKGAGIGAGLLGAIGAAAMGLYQAVYTGNNTGLLIKVIIPTPGLSALIPL